MRKQAMSSTPESPAKTQKAFSCRQCGQCCQGRGGVRLSKSKAQKVADHLQLSLTEFEGLYFEPGPAPNNIRTGSNGFCIFHLHNGLCHIHPVKPAVCQQWPFLPGPLKQESAFLDAKTACPGFDPNLSWDAFKKAGASNL